MYDKRYLIIGQGLAGTVLSYELLRHNIPHKVLDNNHETAATKAAAGIINPVTGRRYVKSWMMDDLLPVAKETYAGLEKMLKQSLVKEVTILRALDSNLEENSWNEATSRPGYDNYIKEAELDSYSQLVRIKQAYGEIALGMQVSVAELIKSYRRVLIERGLLIEESFDYNTFDFDSSSYEVNSEVYDGIIFCDGYRSIYNPLFKDLPFQPAKGESFKVRVDVELPTKLLRDKVFLAPFNHQEFWTGGGYEWTDLSEVPTEKFRLQWTEKLEALLTVDYQITEHLAGVRPSVKGRRPLIGQHPKYANVYLFNGMGTKGTSLAPFWAREFVALISQNRPIDKEVDLNRFLTSN